MFNSGHRCLRAAAVVLAGVALSSCGTATGTVGPTGTLIGPTWRLVSIEGQAAVPGTHVTAVFGDDDRVAGSAGCNRYQGAAVVRGETLAMSPTMATTMMYCGALGVMPQEQAYLAALQKATAYRISGTRLEMGPAPGVVTLVFQLD